MDSLDFKIMEILLDDSRLSFRKIAKELEVSTDTVIRRYKKLKKEGTIKPIIFIDFKKFGYQAGVWYMMSLSPQIDVSSTIDTIAKISNVIYIVKAIGDYDLLVIARVKGFQHMFEIGNDLAKVPGVIKIEGRPYIGRHESKVGRATGQAFIRGFYKP